MRRRPRLGSVRLRITVLATTVVVVALVIGSFALLHLFRSSLLRSQYGTIRDRADAVAALAVDGVLPDLIPALETPRLTLVQVVDVNGAVVAASAPLQGRPPVNTPDDHHRRVIRVIDGLDTGPWLTESTVVTVGTAPVTVIVITSIAGYGRGADLLRTSLLITVPVLAILVAIIVWSVVGRALRPVETMRVEVENITGHRLERRVPAPRSNDEVSKLAVTLNDMLDRLQASSDTQRRFVADASHELRTPIANIRMAMEVASAHPDRADWSAVAEDVLHQDARMQRLTDDLLMLARAEAGPTVRRASPVDVTVLVAAELTRIVPDDRVLRASVATNPLVVIGDADELSRVLTNLVDNALRHASHEVVIGARLAVDDHGTEASSVEITVTDDGPGIDTDDRAIVFDPFVRLDQHRARDVGGTGLGLSIVRRVVEAHGGTVQIATPESGRGASFVVRLPPGP